MTTKKMLIIMEEDDAENKWLKKLRAIARKRAKIDAMSPLLAEQWKPEIP